MSWDKKILSFKCQTMIAGLRCTINIELDKWNNIQVVHFFSNLLLAYTWLSYTTKTSHETVRLFCDILPH